jgi:hypothetical protein
MFDDVVIIYKPVGELGWPLLPGSTPGRQDSQSVENLSGGMP